ncbi:MAG: HipA domain-containing protein [Lachnospiraceae bacterium]|nr:HipA domain-containing protein [Lachnospiraceae bacterium]
MNCLCCGKPLKKESETGWHHSCIKRFFGTETLPDIDLSDANLAFIASENVNQGFTVPGVQKKMSLHLFSDAKQPRLTLVNYPTGYILKPQVEEYPHLPESEHLVMCMADICGIATVPHALMKNGDSLAYISKRVDRIIRSDSVQKLAMEDFCQLDLRLTQDKYKGSYERCSKVITRYSSQVHFDQSELFLRLVFCFLTGNSDMHLKNFSLIETETGSHEYVLSPAYDLLPVNLVLPQDKEQTALTLNGKKAHLRKKDFLVFAENAGIGKDSAEKMIQFLLKKLPKMHALCDTSLLPREMKEGLHLLMQDRALTLS